MRRTPALVSALALAAAMLPSAALAAPSREAVIVVFHDSVENPSAQAQELGRQHRFTPTHVYEHALNGFAATVPAAAAEALRNNRNVARVEPDGTAYPTDSPQSGATWGLDRIDQRTLPLDTTYHYAATGAGVTAYVIDSGILSTHAEFGGRATLGRDFVGTNNGEDCNGHGTHVAGTIGGTTYGVAKDASLVSVRVFDCSGGASWSTVIAAVDWVTADADTDGDGDADEPAVANMSLGGGANFSVDQAVRNSIASGVSYAIAAGNSGRNACNYSPARVAEAMTIGATDKTDTKASWSNYGSCVDWFAPGVSIKSAWYSSNTATNTISGTSMATPHTAGVAALYLEGSPAATPATVRDALYAATTTGVVRSSSSTNNHLLYNLYPDDDGSNFAPTAGHVTASGIEDVADIAWTPVVSDADTADVLTCSIAVAPANGTASVSPNCSSGSYTPGADYNGGDAFTYRVSDGIATANGTVTVTVAPIADDPIAVDDTFSTATNITLTVGDPGVLNNDTDADGDALSAAEIVSGSTLLGGTVSLSADGSFTYSPPADTTGLDSFSYAVTDGTGRSDTATVSINVGSKIGVISLTGSSTNQGSTWTPIATVIIKDASNNPVNGATVSGSWSGGTTGTGTCVTGEDGVAGTCTIDNPGIPKKFGTVQLTVTSVSHSAFQWDGAQQRVVIAKP